MKISDRYLMSLHNIASNKSRSILTTIIVYIMSIVIMALLFIGISYSSNLTKINKEYIQSTLDYVSTDYSYIQSESSNQPMDKNYYQDVKKCLERNETIVDIAKFDLHNSKIVATSYLFDFDGVIVLNEGNYPTKEHCKTNKVMVSEEYANEYFENNNEALIIGKKFVYSFTYYDLKADASTDYELSLEVSGIFKSNNNVYATSSSLKDIIISDKVEIIIDMEYLYENIPSLTISDASFYYSPKRDNFDCTKYLNKTKKFVKELNKILPSLELNGSKELSVYNTTLNEVKIYNTISGIVIGVLSFICIVLVLLSIGSLSNTIMISVNKNRKFIGLLKAMGIKENNLESIIRLESITTITVGIILSFITLICLKGAFVNINEALLNSTVSYLLNEIDYKITFNTPFYIPLIVLAFFLFFTYLFSKTNISKIAKDDPISIISEVA